MATKKVLLPNAHFGVANHTKLKWKEYEQDDDADDVELKHSPKDVVAMLGFDPKKKVVRKAK